MRIDPDVSDLAGSRAGSGAVIEIADDTLTFRRVRIGDLTPTGAQLAVAAGFPSAVAVSVLHFLPNGDLEDVRPTEVVDLRRDDGRFVIVRSDASFRLRIDGQRFDWPRGVISGAVVRRLGQIPAGKAIYLERQDEPDRMVGDQELVSLRSAGVESFVSRKLAWKLNVQHVVLELTTPTITVREALIQAGFKPEGWQIFLKVAGEKKKAVDLATVVDLRTPGIEKLRLTPTDVNNGEAAPPRRDFALLEADETFLNGLGLRWETITEQERRWLVIHGYPLPVGYTAERTKLALEVPTTYPGAQIDSFYAYPPLALASGRAIPRTQLRATLQKVEFHGWSRHRGPGAAWNPAVDNVATHLALVDAALAREVGE